MQSIFSVHPSDTADMQLQDLTGDTKVKTEPSEDIPRRCKAQIEGRSIQTRQEAKQRLEEKDVTVINLISDEEMKEEDTTETQTAGTSLSVAEKEDISDIEDDDKAEAKEH